MANIDKSAGKPHNISISLYVFVADNPLIFVDPNGKDRIEDIKSFDKKSNLTIQESLNIDSINDGNYYVWNNGQIICSGQFKNGKRDGTWFFMNLNHDTIKIENWLSNKKFGQQISYFNYGNHSQVIKNYIFLGWLPNYLKWILTALEMLRTGKGFLSIVHSTLKI